MSKNNIENVLGSAYETMMNIAKNKMNYLESLEKQMIELQELIDSNKAMAEELTLKIELFSITIREMKEQKSGLLAENNDKQAELEELKKKYEADKFGKCVRKVEHIVLPSDKKDIEQVDTMEELIMNDMTYEELREYVKNLNKNK